MFQVGGRRGHDINETQHIQSSLGSGPHAKGLGCGFYSVSDYRGILKHAKELHIEVIPEIDLPGHSHAATVAMRRRYDRYMALNKPKDAEKYLLTDLKQTNKYNSVQHFQNNVVNPCMNSTYSFIDHVVKSLVALHSGFTPLRVIHLGGDEVAEEGTLDSPKCQTLIQHLKTQNITIKRYYTQRVMDIGTKYGLKVQLWEEGAYDGKTPVNLSLSMKNNMYVNGWLNKWSRGDAHRAYELANAGYKV